MKEPAPPRWWRRAAITGAVLVLAPLLLVAGAWLSLRARAVRRAVLARASREIAAATGIAVGAADFRLDPARGVVDLDDISAAVPGRAPFLTVPHVHLELDLGSLRSPAIVIRELEVERPRLDLAAALPRPRPGDETAAAPARRVDVRRLRLRGGAVEHGVVPPAAARWLAGWSLAAIDADGSYVGEVARGSLTVGRVAVELPGGELREARLELAGAARPGGELSLDVLHLTAAGLDVRAEAHGTAAADGPLTATLHLVAEPALLAPRLGSGGRVAAEASVRLPERTVTAHLEATGMAVDALRPLAGADLLERAGAAGTTLDVTADLAGPLADPDRLAGSARLAWNAGSERRLDAAATLGPPPDGSRGVRVAFDAALLPDLAGTRRARGTLAAATLAGLAHGALAPATLTLAAPDLATAASELRARWPQLVPPIAQELPVIGALDAKISASGPVFSPHVIANASWAPVAGAKVTLAASGEPAERRGEAAVTVERLPLALLRPDLGGTVSASARLAGTPERYRALLSLDGERLTLGAGGTAVDALHLEVATDGERLELPRVSGAIGAARFAASGSAALALPLADARLALHLEHPVPQVNAADVALRLDHGVLHLDVPGVDTAAGSAALAATVPLGALRAIPALAAALARAPLVQADGPISVTLDAPALDSCTLLPLLGLPERAERLRADAHAELELDPADPTAAVGELTLAHLRADLDGRSVTVAAPLRLQLADRRVRLPEVAIDTDAIAVSLEGEASLAPRFRPGEDPPAALITSYSADLEGAIDSALLQPYLVGGVASGELRFDAHVAGTPAAPTASFSLYGPDVTLFWPTPYATRLSGVDLTGALRDGVAQLSSGKAALNGGTLTFSGRRRADGGVTARVALANVRYLLDYGASAVLDGDLRLALPAGRRGSLRGNVVLRRAALTRDIDLDREVLRRFFAPVTTAGTESGFLDNIDLDVALSTVDGVKVKNNVADLALTWEPLAIGGTAWNWNVKGRVEVRPGGLVFAYGQTVRIDRGSFTFTGDPINDPRIELATTSSLQDPSIARLAAERGPLAALGQPEATASATETLASGIAGYFGERVGASLGLGEISLRPLLIFGEADPSARLTISRDLSSNVAFAFSLDLRNAQRQTYLLDLHGFHAVPSLTAQVFTNDQAQHGATLQQTLQLGGGPRHAGAGPRLEKVAYDRPAGVSSRALRAAIGYAKGDTLPPAAAFDIEVEVAALLREDGYPDADVHVATAPSPDARDRVDLRVAIEPGPHVSFAFTGEKIPAGSRPLVTSAYRADYYEAATLVEVQKAAVRVLRAAGFLDPSVTVAVTGSGGERTVTVASQGGRRVALGPPRFAGLDDADAALVATRFPTALERAELACGVADADARVLQSLHVLGYPDARIAGRELSADGRTVAVSVVPGSRTRVGAVELTGLSAADSARLRPLLPLAAGDPARADRIALAALAVEDDLHSRGFADARVRTRVAAMPAAGSVTVTLETNPGAAYRVGQVKVEGLRSTSRSFALGVAGLHTDEVFRPLDVATARARLAALGVFSSVAADTARRPDGAADVTFTALELPRFTLAYGLRWQSDQGLSAVVDAIDHNLLGRSITLGARALYERNDRSGRVYVGADNLLGSASSLQWFVERRLTTGDIVDTDSLESTLGLSHPLSRAASGRLYASYHDTRISGTDDFGFPIETRIANPYLGAQLILDTRADPLRGGAGVFASADLSGSGSYLRSDYHYLRMFSQLNTYAPVRVLALPALWAQSVRVGLARTTDQDLIPDVRFFAGGQYSVRGYPNEGLGPTETLGDLSQAVGGAALLVVNEELRLTLPLDLTALVFADAGNVWATTADFGRSLVTSLGLGLRASTPIGVLRLDAAFPLDRSPATSRFTLYFGFGNAF